MAEAGPPGDPGRGPLRHGGRRAGRPARPRGVADRARPGRTVLHRRHRPRSCWPTSPAPSSSWWSAPTWWPPSTPGTSTRRLRDLVTLAVVDRPGVAGVEPPPGWRSVRVAVTPVDVSSTDLRPVLEAGRLGRRDWCPTPSSVACPSAVCTLRGDDCAADPHRVRQHPAAARSPPRRSRPTSPVTTPADRRRRDPPGRRPPATPPDGARQADSPSRSPAPASRIALREARRQRRRHRLAVRRGRRRLPGPYHCGGEPGPAPPGALARAAARPRSSALVVPSTAAPGSPSLPSVPSPGAPAPEGGNP